MRITDKISIPDSFRLPIFGGLTQFNRLKWHFGRPTVFEMWDGGMVDDGMGLGIKGLGIKGLEIKGIGVAAVFYKIWGVEGLSTDHVVTQYSESINDIESLIPNP